MKSSLRMIQFEQSAANIVLYTGPILFMHEWFVAKITGLTQMWLTGIEVSKSSCVETRAMASGSLDTKNQSKSLLALAVPFYS